MEIYIGNLHGNASESQIQDLFAPFGQVEVQIVMDDGGHSKGYALITIGDREQGLRAIRILHQQNFMNRFIEVAESNPDNKP